MSTTGNEMEFGPSAVLAADGGGDNSKTRQRSSSTDEKKPRARRSVPTRQVIDSAAAASESAAATAPPAPAMAAVPNFIRLIQLDDGSFMCGICRRAHFASFEEGCMHEIVCKMIMQQQYALGHQDSAVASAPASATGDGGPNPQFFGPLPPLPLPPPPLLPPPDANSSVHSAPPLPMSMTRQMPMVLPFPPPPPPPGSANNRSRRQRPARKKNAAETVIAEPSSQTKNEAATRSFGVSLVPKEADSGILSDYNYLLTQQIELCEEITTTARSRGTNTKRTSSRIGLRCIHCSGSDRRTVGATFFPSATNFISPGFGNIGSRHLLSGKCPLLPAGIIEQLKAFKLTTQAQSKEEGRIGIDAYCRRLAAESGIVNHVSGRIYHAGVRSGGAEASTGAASTGRDVPEASVVLQDEAKPPAKKKKRKRSKSEKKAANNDKVPDLVSDSRTAPMDIDDDDFATSKSAPTEPAMELENMPLKDSADGNKENMPPTGSGTRTSNDTTAVGPQQRMAKRFTYKPTGLDASSFVPGSVEYFWECKHCSSLPVPCRASGSVVFSAKPPSLEVIKGHLEKCQGLDALPIPRDAKISIGYGESLPPICISFDNKQLKKRSKTIEKQRAALAAGKPWPPLCKDVGPFLPSGEVNPGVEKARLAVKSDLDLTTEFAYTTVTLLRKCYLAKTGGSRGGQSIGFPGLACSFCAGRPNERRFFYTSADMLRNSFSHIPLHVMSCPYAPDGVRQNLESLKALRNNHKAALGPGSHKRFIAQVWKRIHSKNHGLSDGQEYMYDSASDDHDEIKEEACTNNRKDAAAEDVATDAKMPAEGKPPGGQASNAVATIKRRRRQGAKPASTTDSVPGLASTRNSVASASSSRPSGSGGIKYIDTELVEVAERHLTTDLFYLSLQLGCEIYTLKETDVERIGQSVVVGTPVIQCRLCNADSEQIGRIFMPRSAQNLRGMMLAIANHLSSSCPSCPQHIKAQLQMVGGQVREEQESELKRGSALKFVEKVFTRLMAHDKSEKHEEDVVPLPAGASSVVLAGDEALVSGYTHYTLSQMAPCILDETGQGSRSSFALGTPGLACRHCSDSKNARTFYYRNSEVFACNYSHIPSHLLNCPLAPANVKTHLAELKKQHSDNKSKINKGNQRAFFGIVWRRLQLFAEDEKERQKQQVLQRQQQQQQVYDDGSMKVAAVPIVDQVASVASPRTSCSGDGSGEAKQESAPVTTEVGAVE